MHKISISCILLLTFICFFTSLSNSNILTDTPSTPPTPPPPPVTNPKASPKINRVEPTTTSSITVYWSELSGDEAGNQAISSYNFELSRINGDGTTSLQEISVPVIEAKKLENGILFYTFANLQRNTDYKIRMKATNPSGDSPFSETITSAPLLDDSSVVARNIALGIAIPVIVLSFCIGAGLLITCCLVSEFAKPKAIAAKPVFIPVLGSTEQLPIDSVTYNNPVLMATIVPTTAPSTVASEVLIPSSQIGTPALFTAPTTSSFVSPIGTTATLPTSTISPLLSTAAAIPASSISNINATDSLHSIAHKSNTPVKVGAPSPITTAIDSPIVQMATIAPTTALSVAVPEVLIPSSQIGTPALFTAPTNSSFVSPIGTTATLPASTVSPATTICIKPTSPLEVTSSIPIQNNSNMSTADYSTSTVAASIPLNTSTTTSNSFSKLQTGTIAPISEVIEPISSSIQSTPNFVSTESVPIQTPVFAASVASLPISSLKPEAPIATISSPIAPTANTIINSNLMSPSIITQPRVDVIPTVIVPK